MQKVFNFIKKLIGKNFTQTIRPLFHGTKAYLAARYYDFPGHKMTIIGVNGTKGKTTTAYLIAQILNLLGQKTGYSTSALIYDGEKESENVYKMGTIDPIQLQKKLATMHKNNCKFAVLEMTSIGLEQHRHYGIGKFDTAVFLNIYPEHIKAHGSFDNYLAAKGLLAGVLAKNGHFIGNGTKDQIEYTSKWWDMIPDRYRNTIKKTLIDDKDFEVVSLDTSMNKSIKIGKKIYATNFISEVEIIDLYYALKVVEKYQPDVFNKLEEILPKLHGAPGRMDWIVKNGQVVGNPEAKTNFIKQRISILNDYAHEPQSMKKLLQNLKDWKNQGFFTKIIHVLSADGAGRDDWKKPVLGDISWEYSDYTVLTTDNYDSEDNPEDILSMLGQNYNKGLLNNKYFKNISRKKAFNKAMELAVDLAQTKSFNDYYQRDVENKVIIVSTGVGSEFGLTQPNGKIDWDEKQEWLNAFAKTDSY